MLKLKVGQDMVIRSAATGEILFDMKGVRGITCEIELKLYDQNGLVCHIGREGKTDYSAREGLRIDVGEVRP